MTHTDLSQCVLCGGTVSRRPVTVDIAVGARRSVPVIRTLLQCEGCQETYYAPGEMDEVHRAAAAAVREREGLLSSTEIRELRESLGMTQAELEDVLRVGPKTVVRWERGTVFQNKSTDTLLRALRDVPELRDYLLGRTVEAVAAMGESLRITLEHGIVTVADPTTHEREASDWPASTQWTPLHDGVLSDADSAAKAA